MIRLGPFIPERVRYIRDKLERIQAQIYQLDTLIDELTNIESYNLDTAEGSQRVSRRKINDLYLQLERKEAEWEHWIREAYGIGITNMSLRRKNPC